jgi:hypothetical protein
MSRKAHAESAIVCDVVIGGCASLLSSAFLAQNARSLPIGRGGNTRIVANLVTGRAKVTSGRLSRPVALSHLRQLAEYRSVGWCVLGGSAAERCQPPRTQVLGPSVSRCTGHPRYRILVLLPPLRTTMDTTRCRHGAGENGRSRGSRRGNRGRQAALSAPLRRVEPPEHPHPQPHRLPCRYERSPATWA